MTNFHFENEKDVLRPQFIKCSNEPIILVELYRQKPNIVEALATEVIPFSLFRNGVIVADYSLIERKSIDEASISEIKNCLERILIFIESIVNDKNNGYDVSVQRRPLTQ